MIRVAELMDGDLDEAQPRIRPSEELAAGRGADRHVAIRGLAEQLVCEANAVLCPDPGLTLTDDVADGRLGFTIGYRTCRARVSTAFSGGHARAELSWEDHPEARSRELEDAEALPDLIVRLLQNAGVGRSRSND